MGSKLEFPVIRGDVLGINTYRGFGELSEIAKMSRADIYDQKHNPAGTQRDLNVRHAKAAHTYVSGKEFAFWPEVVLCCRIADVVKFDKSDDKTGAGILSVDMSQIETLASKGKIAISRLDGNHRLHFADGHSEGFDPVERIASFCLLMGLGEEDEITLFRDINNNQRRMNTSHLDTIIIRLTQEEVIMREKPTLYVAERLGKDKESPFYRRVWKGGIRSSELHIPLRTLLSGIDYLRQRSSNLEQLRNVEAEYILIRNYWSAVRRWVPEAWDEPKKYLLLRGAGLWGACMLGGYVIDRCIDQGEYTTEAMLEILLSGTSWDWTRNGDFRGFSGRGGASEIARLINSQLPAKSGVSINNLVQKIVSS